MRAYKLILTESEKSKAPTKVDSSSIESSNDCASNNLEMTGADIEKPCGCGKMGSNTGGEGITPSYVYSIGRIQARFPNPSIEKELAQAIGRAETTGQTDSEALKMVLSQRQNRYLARKMCWVLTIEGVNTYILTPHDPADFELLIDALRPSPRATDIDVVVGIKGPMVSPEVCNGLIVPIAVFDQIYSFDVDGIIKAIPRPEKVAAKDFSKVAEELFTRIMQMHDNAGNTDEQRAVNYIAVRYDAIYSTAFDMYGRDFSLSGMDARLSSLSGSRKIVDVIFSFTNRNTDVVEKYFTRVDVTEEFPFLVTRMSPYYDKSF